MAKTIKQMTAEVIDNLNKKGWREGDQTIAGHVCNLHGEVSEIWEAYRSWGLKDVTDTIGWQRSIDGMPKPEGVGPELADLFIRILDDCEFYGIDLDAEYERKMAYNRLRPYRHGGKLA